MTNIKVIACILVIGLISACVCNRSVEHSHLTAIELPVLTGSDDIIAFKAHQWVHKNITYVADDVEGTPDRWQDTKETLEKKQGDCEDGALLVAHILIKNGVPKEKIRVVGGYVIDPATRMPFGHAYCIYKRNDGEWITLDWCAFSDEYMPLKTRMPLRFKEMYGKIRFYLLGE
jgi:predicted transglutaminase-like cysteine proteinase